MDQPKVSFAGLVASLATGAAAALGEIEALRSGKAAPASQEGGEAQPAPHEVEERTKVALSTARHLIDTIGMLEEKTRGNLSAEEAEVVRSSLASLRIGYVKLAGPPK